MFLNLTLNGDDEDILINFDNVSSVVINDSNVTEITMSDNETVFYVSETLEQIKEWLAS